MEANRPQAITAEMLEPLWRGDYLLPAGQNLVTAAMMSLRDSDAYDRLSQYVYESYTSERALLTYPRPSHEAKHVRCQHVQNQGPLVAAALP